MSVVRTGPSPERLALVAKVRELRDRPDPLTHRQIAVELGISRSYANALDLDPDGSKTRVRKDSYGGTCVDCGARTDGSNGASLAPERCGSCSRAKQKAEKTWTRDAVISAIQRFAVEHGRPPTSIDWIHADPDRGYPNRGSVYRTSTNPGCPFANWADAIEAAGFPRPPRGRARITASRAREPEAVTPLKERDQSVA